jgi:hypothetical protein
MEYNFKFYTSYLFSIVFVLLLTNTQSVLYPNCPYYSCNQQLEKTKTSCMTSSLIDGRTLNYTFTPCEEEGTYCNFDSSVRYPPSTDAYCVKKSQASSLTTSSGLKVYGEYCSEDNECFSKKCKGKKCTGFKYEEECDDTYYCEGGLYCGLKEVKTVTKQVCKDQINIDSPDQPCTNDFECSNDRICDNSRCKIPYFLADGELSDNPKMCRSGRLSSRAYNSINTNTNSDYYRTFCDSFMLYGTTSQICPSNGSCQYENVVSKTLFSLPCVCTLTSPPQLMCPPDQRSSYRDEQAFNLITLGKAHTFLRDVSNWEKIKYDRFYPNREMDVCVSNTINKSNYNIVNIFLLLSILMIFL